MFIPLHLLEMFFSYSLIYMATKQQWGSITWILLHTLAEKIKEDCFVKHRDYLIGLVPKICMVLPCPSCSAHCTQYVKKIRMQNIKTKGDYITFLNQFHNTVNQRLRKPMVTLRECREKYQKARLIKIISMFVAVFSMKDASPNLMTNNMYKQRFLTQFKEDIKEKLVDFDLTV